MYIPNLRPPKYMKPGLTELKGNIDNNPLMEDFSTLLSITDRATTKSIRK
jgi:hypothetical protein